MKRLLLSLFLCTAAALAAPLKVTPAAQAVLDAIKKNDATAALAAAQKGHAAGDASCTYFLGQMHELGRGVPKADAAAAYKLYEQAAKARLPEAMTAQARCLELGIGTEANFDKAMFLWQQAAEAGDGPALSRIGLAEKEGQGRPANVAAALPWLEKAAAASDPLGLWLLSRFYEEGLAALTPDIPKAVELCARAATGGQQDAMHQMGRYYETGTGFKPDIVAATGWYRLAADQGHPAAMASLCLCHLRGQGVVPDPRFAIQLAAASARAGHPRGQYLMARILDEGLGCAPSPVFALMYHLRAHKNGIEEAQTAITRLKGKLDSKAITQAETLAAQAAFHMDAAEAKPVKPK